jgi:23S rRNA pseudouridine1911/1915/1917 synthase
MDLPILFENENFLVINKPFGVVVNRADSIKGRTVQDWVESKYDLRTQELKESRTQDGEVFLARSGVCHRLDKETSGCLLIAKNPRTMKYFLSLFKDRKITKSYLALVHGRVDPKEGDVILPLKRSIIDRDRWKVRFDGKKAITMWSVMKYFEFSSENEQWKNTLSLLDVGLKTGRTHQIRVHLSFLGWPIFADAKYLNGKQFSREKYLLNHHFLHAYYLNFKDEFGERHEIKAPLPEDCEYLLKTLKEID